MRAASLAGVVALMLPSALAFAQEAMSFAELLAGKKVALKMSPKDLPDDFKPVKLKVAGSGGGGLMDMIGSMFGPFAAMMGAGSSSSDKEGAMVMKLLDTYWTKGDIVRVQGKDYVVAYKWNLDLTDVEGSAPGTDPGKSKHDALQAMVLSLSLVAVDSITSIAPVADMTKQDLIKFLETPYTPPAETTPPEAGAAVPADSEETTVDPSSDQGKTLAGLKQVSVAITMYVADYDDVYPAAQSTKAVQYVTFPYCKNFDVWRSYNPNSTRFLFNMAISGVSLASIEEPADLIMFYEERPWPNGDRAVAFCDGHVKMVTKEEWSGLESGLRLKLPKSAKPFPMNYGLDWNPGGGLRN